jgi:replicative DNA helicase
MNETPLPYSPHTEESLLGAALLNPDVLNSLDTEPCEFFIDRHKIIWQVLRDFQNRNLTPDFITIGTELDRLGKLEYVGGAGYLTQLIHSTPSFLAASSYAEMIRDAYNRRCTIQTASNLVAAAMDQSSALGDAIANAMSEFVRSAQVSHGAVQVEKFLTEAYNEIEARSENPQDVWGIPTGFLDYDRLTGGLQSTELVVLSGDPGMGKSIFAMQLGEQLSEAQHPGAIYSLEMTGKAVARRMLSARSQVETRKLKSGKLEGDDWAQLVGSFEELQAFPLYMSDATDWTTTSLRADLARLKRQVGIEWFILDYAYLMQDGSGKLNETEKTGLIINNLKSICKSLDLAGVAIHSKRKDGQERKSASLSQLRGSGQIAYDADVVLFLDEHRPGIDQVQSSNMRTVIFSKGREIEAPKRFFHLVLASGYPRFLNYAKETANNNGHRKEPYYDR